MGWLRDRLSRWFRPTPPPPTPQPTSLLARLLVLHNAQRAGTLPDLMMNEQLNQAAQKHAEWMASKGKLSHTGLGGSTFIDRVRKEGYWLSTGGENIAAGYDSADSVVAGWMASSGHRKNIVSSAFTEVGFGRSGDYWCAVFAAPGAKSNFVMAAVQAEGIRLV